ncbi:MAG: alpha/beta fold hydrolase [Polyangiales bacterium]
MAQSPTAIPSNNPSVLVTGATGLIGRWLLARLSREGQGVAALVRGGEARRPELARFVSEHGGEPQQLTLIDGELGEEEPFAAAGGRLNDVRDVYHLAAAFQFGMKPAYAQHINVGGTLRVAAFAKTLPKLRRFVALGGYRATRLPDWLENSESRAFDRLYKEHGAYEASKLEAHLALQDFAQRHDLPLTSVHPSTVIGSSLTGETSQLTGLAEMVERLWRHQMPALVGTAQTFLPIVCVDYLADFLASVPANEATLGQDLCVLDSQTPNLPELIAHMAGHMGVRAPHRIVSKALVAALPEAITGVDKETLTFLSEDRYDTRSAEEHARQAGLQMPEWGLALERWIDFLVSTRFLQGESTRSLQEAPGRFVSCAGSQTYLKGDVEEAETLFLHGLPWDGESGRPLASAMNERLLRPDLPGMGRSSASTEPLDEWLAALLAPRTRPIRIVAHSLSTGIALRYANRWPDKVSELVLVSPFFLQAPAPLWLRCPAVTSGLLRFGDDAAMSRRLLSDELPPRAVTSAHAHLRRRGVSWTMAKALSEASSVQERSSLVKELHTLTSRWCVVHGALDPIKLEGFEEGIARAFVIDAGHNPHVQKPVDVARVIQRWRTEGAENADALAPTTISSRADDGIRC